MALYQAESIRRARLRFECSELRKRWAELNRLVFRGSDGPLEAFFDPKVRLELCFGDEERRAVGLEAVQELLPLLKEVCQGHQELHVPCEEAKVTSRQLVVGLKSGATLRLLFRELKIYRMSLWGEALELPALKNGWRSI